MKATDYIKMPERIDNIYEVEMNDKEMKLYRKLEKKCFCRLPTVILMQ